jgi:cell division protein FtsN
MARDYNHQRSSRQGNNSSHPLLVMTVTFLLGYLTATVFDVETISRWINQQVQAHQQAGNMPAKSEPQRAQLPPKPKFEFYTLLANEKGPSSPSSVSKAVENKQTPVANPNTNAVVAAAASAAKPELQHQAIAKTNDAKQATSVSTGGRGAYTIQVASFKARQDAENMKGLLTLKGFNVSVVAVNQAQGSWFRVIVGPIENRDMALKAQTTLARTEHINGMLRNTGA